ncbi:MAG: hypothetical protein COV45_05830 [Deltaproteobacteria bacterium CG11_big_fil_rev_8_21_14_0_20_47_16]|nr:MAG: hypothetical protein COV45_05830 [Deltaproteobacteria bacterium CG11_big_fil_rev_8_21_14_0_20_47_16]
MMLKQEDKRSSRWYQSWLKLIAMPYSSAIWLWASFALVAALITLIMTMSFSSIPSRIKVGQQATYDIRADRNYTIVDDTATRRMKEAAADQSLLVYSFNQSASSEEVEKIRKAFNQARETGSASSRDLFEETVGIGLTDKQWAGLQKGRFSRSLEDTIVSVVQGIMHHPIVSDKATLLAEKEKGVVVVDRHHDDQDKQWQWDAQAISVVWSLDDAKKQVMSIRSLGKDEWLPSLVAQLIHTNMFVNLELTRGNQVLARESVPNVVLSIQSGDVIIHAGEKFEPRHELIIQGIRKQLEQKSISTIFLGYFILVSLILWVSYFFGSRFIPKFHMGPRDIRFVAVMLIVALFVVRISLFLTATVAASPYLNIPSGAYVYAIPVAIGAMLIRLVLNAEVALIFSIVVSIFCGFFVLHDPEYTAYCLLSNIAATSFIANVDKRSNVMRAGLKIALVNVVIVGGLLLAQSYHNPAMKVQGVDALWYLAAALTGGIMNSVLVLFAAPFVETIFGYTTDMRLLELANLNHPLLRELIIRAPGTYHHSHLVGILSESASERIGGNPLLARVGAYYHDIGKMRKPQYYIENSKDNANWHEKISPHMAALIISSHIKDGVEMAQQYGLPQQIIDMIPQHHGTKKVSFFYELAKKSNDPELQTLSEDDFRYPGPKPQTKEAGILLLADGVEAAVRALKEKTPTRIQQMVESIINKSFVESQLDECDLTLRDLTDIADAFTHILSGIYHQRIEYPKQATEVAEKDKVL